MKPQMYETVPSIQDVWDQCVAEVLEDNRGVMEEMIERHRKARQ